MTTVAQSNFSYNVPLKLIQQVRSYIQDFVQTNEIFEGQEVTDDMLAKCLVDTLDDWNYSPPILSYFITISDLMSLQLYQGVRKWIVDMAAMRALRIISIKHAKQDIPYTAGNVNIQPHAVWRNLENIIALVKIDYENYKQQFKLAQNMENCYTISHTELWDGFINDIDGT